jgi:hypothetical protein
MGGVKKYASIVLCFTNSTYSSAIYKLTSRLVGWLRIYSMFNLCIAHCQVGGVRNRSLLFGALQIAYDAHIPYSILSRLFGSHTCELHTVPLMFCVPRIEIIV